MGKTSNKISKAEYSKKLNDRLGMKEVLGHDIDFTKLKLKDLLDLNEVFMDPAKLKMVAVSVGSEILSGDLLEALPKFLEGKGGDEMKNLIKDATGGAKAEEVVNTVVDVAENELKNRFPLVGQIAERARQRLKARRKNDETGK